MSGERKVEMSGNIGIGRGSGPRIPSTNLLPTKTGIKKGKIPKIGAPVRQQEEGITVRLSQLETATKADLELDLQIQTERIIHILETTYKKLELAACLQEFLNDRMGFLEKHLKSSDYEFMMQTCDPFMDTKKALGIPSDLSALLEKISKYNFGKRRHSDIKQQLIKKRQDAQRSATIAADKDLSPHLTQVIDTLFENREVMSNLYRFRANMDEKASMFLDCFRRVQECAKERLTITAKEMRERHVLLRKAWKENTDAEVEIEKMETILEKQRKEIGEQMQVTESLCKDYEDKIGTLQTEFRDNIKRRIKKSEDEMINDTRESEARQVDLAAEAEKIRDAYNSLLSLHLGAEKALRVKKFKTETQLASWLAKYDTDVGERHAELERLEEEFEKEQAELDALQEKFDEQEEEYDVLMAEKEEYEEAEFNAKRYLFIMNRAARRIQRYWRAYRARMKLRRQKPKKGKGKGKEKGKGKGKGKKK